MQNDEVVLTDVVTGTRAMVPTTAQSSGVRMLNAAAAERLREMIVHGVLAPGARLNERELTAMLGVSRTPLREATRMLASEGLVDLLPNRGARVAALNVETVQHTLAVMGALEALAGELACAKAGDAAIAEIRATHYEMLADHARRDLDTYFKHNQAVHLMIIDAAGNPVLSQLYRSLNDQVRRVRYMANLSQARWDKAIAEHNDIMAALDQRDAGRLKAMLADHLAHKLTVLSQTLAATAAPNAKADKAGKA
ncbi:MAG TPA: GntR family transcriptional regulator [Usitatibacteraceae bacterium]